MRISGLVLDDYWDKNVTRDAAADRVAVALLTVHAVLWALRDASGGLLLRLVHVTGLVLGAARQLLLYLLCLLVRTCCHFRLRAGWFCEGAQTGVQI